MKLKSLLLFFVCSQFGYSQLKIISWNIENLGKSKSDSTITFLSNVINNYDIAAIQEVVAGYGGAQTVAKLSALLNQSGAQWDYSVSDPTTSSAYKTERYAFLWKTKVVKKVGVFWLEQKYNLEIDREPYYGTFMYKNKSITLVNFHAITKSKQPETEIKYFKFLPENYPDKNLVFLGDFNCPQSHTVFNPLRKMGYLPVFINQKTTLKKKCNNSTKCLSSEFDNIWFDATKNSIKSQEVIQFYKSFSSLQQARKISDHLPISATIKLK